MKLPEKLEKKRDELAFEWVAKDDGSLGHCPECYQEGFNAACEELLPLIQDMIEAMEKEQVDKSCGPHSYGCCGGCDSSYHIECSLESAKQKLGDT